MLQEQEDRMPTIAEDKQWPRLSLEYELRLGGMFPLTRRRSEEIQKLGDPTDSPDLQQPPLSVYRDGPIPYTRPTAEQPADDTQQDGGMLPELLAVNLEPRRRRRESGNKAHGKKVIDFAPSPERGTPAPEQKAMVRAGSKRKLSVRDDSDSDAAAAPGRKALAQDVDDKAERVHKERGAKPGLTVARIRQERRALESSTSWKRDVTKDADRAQNQSTRTRSSRPRRWSDTSL
jgi:hypothetical protein